MAWDVRDLATAGHWAKRERCATVTMKKGLPQMGQA